MKRELPPLNALVAFEHAARNKCFKHAADEMAISKSAVSKQITKLEGTLGTSLFQRHKRGNELTEAGLAYRDLISRAFDIVEFATATTRNKNGQHILTCETPVTFGEWWLTPALVKYRNLYPNVIPKLITRDSLTCTESKTSDLSIFCHPVSLNSGELEPLFNENLMLVASREYMKTNKLTDLKESSEAPTLIGRSDRKNILHNVLNRLTNVSLDNATYLEYKHFYMVKSAVKNHIGIGLVPDYLCHEDIENGNLINIMDYQCQSGFTYSLKVAEHKRACKKTQQFINWLKHTALPCNSFASKNS